MRGLNDLFRVTFARLVVLFMKPLDPLVDHFLEPRKGLLVRKIVGELAQHIVHLCLDVNWVVHEVHIELGAHHGGCGTQDACLIG